MLLLNLHYFIILPKRTKMKLKKISKKAIEKFQKKLAEKFKGREKNRQEHEKTWYNLGLL